MSHIVTARHLLVEDIAPGVELLIPHGPDGAYVLGRIAHVKDPDSNGVLHFDVKSETGFETGSSFPTMPRPSGNARVYVTPDPEGDLECLVPDYIGSVVSPGPVLAEGRTPEEAATELYDLLIRNGYKLPGRGALSSRPVTEQQVVVKTGHGDNTRAFVGYEFETQMAGSCSYEYLDLPAPTAMKLPGEASHG